MKRTRKVLLWVPTLAALVAPGAALWVRSREATAAEARYRAGLTALDASVARPERTDWSRVQRDFAAARRADVSPALARSADALYHVARAYGDLTRGDVSLALTEAQTAATASPEEPRAAFALALANLRRGERARAERLFEQVESSRETPPALRERSEVYHVDVLLDAGRGHAALSLAETLGRRSPRSADAQNRLGLARFAVGDVEGAAEAYRAASEIDPSDPSPVINLAQVSRARGDLPGARALLERALGVDRENGEAWLAYGVVLGDLGAEHFHAARAAILRAGQKMPDRPEPWVAQGELDLRESHWTDAAESFRQALQRSAEHVGARTNLGVALARAGDREGASRAFQEVTQRAPQTGEAWNGLGAMRLALNDAEGAVGPLQQAMVLLPRDPNPAMNLGLALERLQRWDDAVRAFRETLRREPAHQQAMRHMATLQPRNPRWAMARATAPTPPAGG